MLQNLKFFYFSQTFPEILLIYITNQSCPKSIGPYSVNPLCCERDTYCRGVSSRIPLRTIFGLTPLRVKRRGWNETPQMEKKELKKHFKFTKFPPRLLFILHHRGPIQV